jgi:hypothetical protein
MSWISKDAADVFDGGGLRPSTIVHFVCYAGLLILVGVLVHVWVQEAVGRARAEAKSETEKIVRAEADQRIADREKAFGERLDALKKENAEIRSQKQAVQVVEKYIPLAAPAAQLTRQDFTPEVAAKLPDSPSFTTRTEAQEIALAKEVNQCQQDKAGLAKCQADAMDAKAKLESTERERDEWKKSAKGGSRMKRFAGALKNIGIGIGIGLALGHKF